jgi:two-component system, chemotaxis family, protein-glutamate methylesterase/glutaminase
MSDQFPIVVIGASAGGFKPLTEITGSLEEDFPAPVLAVIHLSSESKNFLPTILNRKAKLEAVLAETDEQIKPGCIYIGRADFHLVVDDGRISLFRGPKENGHRPSIDSLFRSAARNYGPRAIGVILSGALDDGVAGLISIKKNGGTVIVQDPDEAAFPDMPRNALKYVKADYCVPSSEIAQLLMKTTKLNRTALNKKKQRAGSKSDHPHNDDRNHKSVNFTCPICHGPLTETLKEDFLQFSCKLGHILSPQSLTQQQADEIERALWTAIRALDDRVATMRRIRENVRKRDPSQGDSFEEKAVQAEKDVILLRKLICGKLS